MAKCQKCGKEPTAPHGLHLCMKGEVPFFAQGILKAYGVPAELMQPSASQAMAEYLDYMRMEKKEQDRLRAVVYCPTCRHPRRRFVRSCSYCLLTGA